MKRHHDKYWLFWIVTITCIGMVWVVKIIFEANNII